VFDQEFVPHTPGTVLDSCAQVNILEGTLGSGTRIQRTGITGDTTEAERADAMFPVLDTDGSRHVISIRGKNIVTTRTTDNILSLAVLLKAGYKVEFCVATDLDPTDGGDLYTPKGKRIALVFSGNLWSEGGLPDTSRQATCLARASQPKKKRRKSKKAKGTVIASPAEASDPPLVAVVAPCLVHPPQHRMHIDYAHSITLGRNKDLYYLIIVIDSIDFTWAQPSPNRSEPQDLIHDFMTLTGWAHPC
jgi:hypothetical protein